MDRKSITYRIIGCTMEIHSALGPDFQELIYQRSLSIALQGEDISFEREVKQTVYFKGLR